MVSPALIDDLILVSVRSWETVPVEVELFLTFWPFFWRSEENTSKGKVVKNRGTRGTARSEEH